MQKDLAKIRKLMLSRQGKLNKLVHNLGVIKLEILDYEDKGKFYIVDFRRTVRKWNPLTYILYVPVVIGLYVWDEGLKELFREGLWIDERFDDYTIGKGESNEANN